MSELIKDEPDNITELIEIILHNNPEYLKNSQILKDFLHIAYYINYNDKIPTKEEINLIEKICFIEILFHNYQFRKTNFT